MEKTVFDAGSFVEFDLASGRISSACREQLALVPMEALAALQPGAALSEAAHRWGARHGEHLVEVLGDSIGQAPFGALAEHLGGTLAALGMGRIKVEVVKDALCFRARLGAAPAGRTALVAGFLTGYLRSIGGRAFEVVHLADDGGEHLFFAGNPKAVERVRHSMERGTGALAAIAELPTRSE